MGILCIKKKKWLKRKRRIRKSVNGTGGRPRLTVFRSAKHVYCQIVDDTVGETLVSASSVESIFRSSLEFKSKVMLAKHVGKKLAERALKEGIEKVVFDRNGFLYHGRIRALSDGAREAGLNF